MIAEGRVLHKCLPVIFFVVCSIAGCATTDDLRRVRADLNRQIQMTNEKIIAVEQRQMPLREEIAGLRSEVANTQEKAIQPLRASQAEGRAEITEIREQIQQIRGTIDGLRRETGSVSARTAKRDEEEKALREKLDNLTFKINFIENFLGIGKAEGKAAAEKAGKQPPASPAKEVPGKSRTDKESLYNAAYELFKEAKYEKSREAFESFLKQYPDTEFSDNAQFWIGECYYFEKKYEKAIVEYEKVVKSFPDGNRVPHALLKQGLSFQSLGDNVSAKLLLQQVIKDYPNTSQARIARAKLIEIK